MNLTQKKLWEKIYSKYKSHYFDYWSNRYKTRFIFNKITSFCDFNDKDVLEICCGSGENARFFTDRFSGVRIVGMDISKNAVDDFRLAVNGDAFELDVQSEITAFDESFDVIYVLGGIHHCTKNIDGVIGNAYRMLKHNGLFIMHEPNSRFLLEPIRKLWYRKDSLFDDGSEHALNHEELLKIGVEYGFKLEALIYCGGPGFFFILQSMVLRIPKPVKNFIAPLFYYFEILWDCQNIPMLNNTFMSCWKKIK